MLSDRFQTLFDAIRTKGETSALIGHDHSLSWAALGRRIGAIHAALIRSETPPASPVLLQGHKECDLIAAMIAAALAGRAFVFADQSYPVARVAQVVEACGCTLALCSLPNMPDAGLPRIDTFTLADATLPATGLDPAMEDAWFYITFTSGSTGVPKGIPIRRSAFDAFMAWFEPLNTQSAGGGGAHVAHANLAFDMSMSDIWTTLFAGRSLYLLHQQNTLNPRANLRQMLSAADAIPGTLTATPAFFQLMLEDSRFASQTLPQLKSFWVGGEAVPKPMLRRLVERFPGCEIHHAYGPSEVTCITHSHRLQHTDLVSDGPLPLGGQQPGLLVRVDDGSGILQCNGEGEVVLLGPQVAEGYLPRNHPANAQFGQADGLALYRTGDFGAIDATGCLTIRGRIDAQVKINGHRVELGEIERIAAQVPGVALAVALPTAEAAANRGLILVLSCEDAGKPEEEASHIAAVRSHLKSRLPGWMVPARIVVSTDLPVQISGKIDRRAARERFGMV